MDEKNWRVQGSFGLMILLVVCIICEFIIYGLYDKKVNDDFDKLASITTAYIDSFIDNFKNVADSFVFPDVIDVNNTEMVEEYLKKWAEAEDLISKITFTRYDDKQISYSVNDEKTISDLSVDGFIYKNAVYSFYANTYSSFDDKKILFCKKVYDGYKLQGVITIEVPYSAVFDKLDKLSLSSDKFNLVIKDTYDNVIYTNSYDLNNVSEETGFNIAVFDQSGFKSFVKELNLFESYVDLAGSRKVETIKICNSGFAKVLYSAKINTVSNNLDTRMVVFCALLVVSVFLCMIFGNFITTRKGKVRIYVLAALVIQIIVLKFVFIESTNLMHMYDIDFSLKSNIIYETLQVNNNISNNVISMFDNMIGNSNDYETTFTDLVNAHFIKLITKNPSYQSISLIKDGSVIKSYPARDEIVQQVFTDKQNEILNKYIYEPDDDTYTINYTRIRNSNYYLAIKTKYIDYLKMFDNNDVVTRYETEDLNAAFQLLSSHNIVTNVNDNIILIKKFDSENGEGYVVIKNDNGNIIDIFMLSSPNYMDNVLTIGIICCICVFLVEVIIYALAVHNRKRMRDYENSIREENKNLDKLLSKINDDVLDIDNTFKFEDDIE